MEVKISTFYLRFFRDGTKILYQKKTQIVDIKNEVIWTIFGNVKN